MRPLTERMEQYARNDTHYLKPLADKLRAELEEKGRLGWHQESCASLVARDCSADKPDDTRYGVARQRQPICSGGPALAVLRELWKWRERGSDRQQQTAVFCVEPRGAGGHGGSGWNEDGQSNRFFPRHLSERRRAKIRRRFRVDLNYRRVNIRRF